jgi:hypothetical protein
MTTECPKWLCAGARALDTATGRTGVVQFLQSGEGVLHTGPVTQAVRVRLRPVEPSRTGWWAEVGTLCAMLP